MIEIRFPSQTKYKLYLSVDFNLSKNDWPTAWLDLLT